MLFWVQDIHTAVDIINTDLELRFQGKSGIEHADSQSVQEHVPEFCKDIMWISNWTGIAFMHYN